MLAKFEGSRLTLAAADNYRIAVRTIDILDPVEAVVGRHPGPGPQRAEPDPVRHGRPVELVLATARNQVLFHLDGIDLVSRLIDGQFPNYQQVLPASHATRAEMDREELLRAVRPAALIASSSANIVKLQVGGEGSGITVTATAEVGDYTGDVEATVEGDATTIAFNARYLNDVLGQRRRGPVLARAQRAPLAGRLPPGRRRTRTSTS